MTLQTIPRTAVRSWLTVTRFPLTAAELAAGKRGTAWPPAVAYEAFEAGVKRGVGSLLGDDELVREGTLERGKVDLLRRSAELEASAEERRRQGEARFDQKKESVQQHAEKVEQEQQARERKLEQEKAQRERAIEAADRRKAEAARSADAARQKAVAAQERQARTVRLNSESKALEEEREAVEAKAEVQDIDQALKATKAARKRS
jgi:hypothetical protein